MLQKLLLFLLVAVGPTLSSPLTKATQIAELEYRLPVDVAKPSAYHLYLTLADDVFDTNTFSGRSTIEFSTLKPTNEIKLHSSVNLSVVRLTNKVPDGDGTEIVQTYARDNETAILTVTVSGDELPTGDYLLYFEFTGELSTKDMYGFYRSEYEEDGKVKHLATTQFQPTHARRAFPCFDEPGFKAIFTVSIEHARHLTAHGNAVGSRQNSNNNPTLILTNFEPTPPMSTYLLAFIVSEFTCTAAAPNPSTPHSVCSSSSSAGDRAFALAATTPLVGALEAYTGVAYADSRLTKLAQFAIPDFAAGAMENWGLITYRETALLWNEAASSAANRQSVATIIAHELAHQWFGNWVTTHWWSDTFLNEGFATFFETYTTAEVYPDWKLAEQFVYGDVQRAMDADASESAHALTHEVNSPGEIDLRFTAISYSKGGTVLRMIESIVTPEKFKAGLRKYLTDKQFDTATPEDLWQHLQAELTTNQLPTTLALLLDNWIKKTGFPVLAVVKSDNSIKITQTRFLLNGKTTSDKWFVPISYTKSSDTNKFQNTAPQNWLQPTATDLTINNVFTTGDANEWVVLNNQVTGYYRVDYSEELWKRIASALKTDLSQINVMNRAQIVDDLFNFARVKRQTYSSVFEYIAFLEDELEYVTWSSASNGFTVMLQRTGDVQIRTELNNLIGTLISKLYKSVPFTNLNPNDHVYTLKQVLAHSWACRVGTEDCIQIAQDEFAKYKQSKTKPNPNLKNVIYCNGLRYSNDTTTDFNFLWAEYGATELMTEKVSIISALGCVRDDAILKEYLAKSITEGSGIRSQDALSVFSSVYNGNPGGVDIALEFLINNYQAINEQYTSMNALNSMFSGLANRLTTQQQVDTLDEFSKKTDVPQEVRNFATSAVTSAKLNLEWTLELEKSMREHFNIPESSSGTIPSATIFVFVLIASYLLY